MKYILSILLVLATLTAVKSQVYTRNVRFRTIGKDSIDLSLNDEYYLIEDSCAQIIRHGHFNMHTRKFFKAFKDVSKQNPVLILSEGTYTDDGIKTGPFISHYFNGNLQSKGAYKDNKFVGHWEMYYEDGKPSLTFEAADDGIKIIDSWDNKGKKIIDNGKGTYIINFGQITWKGKLENGRPDGTWHAYRSDDATQTYIVDEHFKKGQFDKGSNTFGTTYTDASKLMLVDPEKLPYINTEKMMVSAEPCNGIKAKHIVGAQYRNGIDMFSQYIAEAVKPYISTVNIKDYENELVIDGEVSENGSLINLTAHNAFNDNFARGIISQLRRLPALQPATADGKPIRQKFNITFNFHGGMYHFSYRFLNIKQSDLK